MPSPYSSPLPQGTPVQCNADSGFMEWLAASKGSLVVSTYQAGKLLMIGWAGNQLSLLMRQYDKPMGMDISGNKLVLATRNGVTLHSNDAILAKNYKQAGQYDALYLPKVSWHTGDLNIHDIAFANDDVWFANTRFSCLSKLSDNYNFEPKWRPSFVSGTVPEDRCHLNGLAMVKNQPRYVTCLGESDTPGGWRDNKVSGGIIVDIKSNEIVQRDLAMPHSPRFYQNNLYVLNSGAGELLKINVNDGSREVICQLQGYLRGLSFVGNYAIVGLCKIRESNIFGGMPVQEKFATLLSGIVIINIKTGKQEGLFEFTSGCEEIFDTRFLTGIQRPNIFNTEKPEALEAFNAPEFSYWLRPKNMVEDLT
ncbi:MAG: TIGR03032 family protein [Thiotrichaceae bacterium]|nr:MAG: TIGR03032 family protein [Thiotrichaceae bacterium]